MRQVDVAIMGTLALLWLAGAITAFATVSNAENATGTPEEQEFLDNLSVTLLLSLGVVALGYVAATIGMARSEPWGRGMVFVMTTFTMLTVIGIPVAIAQFVALTRPGIEWE